MGMMRIQMHAYITLLVSCIIPRFRIIWQLLTPGHFEETKSMESNLWETGWSFFLPLQGDSGSRTVRAMGAKLGVRIAIEIGFHQ